MALRKSKDDKRTPGADGGGGVAVEERPGESVEECVALGQALVETGSLPADSLAEALTDGKGDLWLYGNTLLTKYGVGRREYAAALGTAVGLPVANTQQTEANPEVAELVAEAAARKYYFVPVSEEGGRIVVWGADCSKVRRDAAEAATGKKFEWFATDPKTVTSYTEQMWRSDADIGRLVASFQWVSRTNVRSEMYRRRLSASMRR